MTDDDGEKDHQRRALGRLLVAAGELLKDDDKRARLEARILEIRAQIGNDPRLAIELARTIAAAMRRG